MKVIIDVSFEHDVNKIKQKNVLLKLADIIEAVKNAEKMSDIKNCKKLKGSRNVYRIRLGNYRAGFYYENRIIDFIRFLHRKDIYKYFPK